MPEVTWLGLAAAPAVIGVVRVFRTAFEIPARWLGLLSLTLGLAAGLGYSAAAPDVGTLQGILEGIEVGLAASGAYAVAKHARESDGVMDG